MTTSRRKTELSTRLTAELARTATDQARATTAAGLERIADRRAQHATVQAELTSALQRFQDEQAHTYTRLADQRATHQEQIAELREELRQAHE